jgi:NTP pyrophosphatase (non-canonical NTP hydrolase)
MSKTKRYYLYHIPGLKIGVTSNIQKRVIDQQGYKAGEYEILASSDDKDVISEMEFNHQRSFGYETDRQSYSQVTREKQPYAGDKPNVTNQTVTFPCPVVKLENWITDRLPLSIKLPNESIATVTKQNVDEFMKAVDTSQWRNERCYIYNKKLIDICKQKEEGGSNDYKSLEVNEPMHVAPAETKYKYISATPPQIPNENVFDLIRMWANDKGIYDKGDSKTQYLKLMEEAGELAEAILKEDEPEIIDAIGDMVVVLTNLARMEGHKIEDCVKSSYSVIKERTGQMINGTFVKNETL